MIEKISSVLFIGYILYFEEDVFTLSNIDMTCVCIDWNKNNFIYYIVH